MGTSQTSKLLTYLLSERERWVSASLLSERLSVSTRQIRKYITKLNEDAAGMLIISSSIGYRLDLKRYQEYIKN
ncbi:helix-turn-helix domain-containing protein, partial [Desulfovibrio desulfuricans]|uniref:HTH domain-containing protein n=1 Tax=Desulfovibrio desulfuricans TaxID=876 RepID=UPI001D099159